MNIFTHAGLFHADDVFCMAALKFLYKDLTYIRIKDDEVEHAKMVMAGSDEHLMVDVGGVYDGKRFFDHHQAEGFLTYQDGTKMSAFGQLWENFGPAFVDAAAFNSTNLRDVALRVTPFVREIDLIDNGRWEGSPPEGHISRLISAFNEFTPVEDGFNYAVGVAGGILEALITRHVRISNEVGGMEKQISAQSPETPILYFSKPGPWQEPLFRMNHPARFVIFPDTLRGGVKLQCVPPTLEEWTKQRHPLPQEWVSTPPEGCTFVHPDRWIAAFKDEGLAWRAAESLV